jgi:hypothetical protein
MKSNRDGYVLTFYLEVVTRVQQVLCCNSDTPPQVYPDQDGERYHAFLLCLLDIKIVHTLSNKATGSQQERKKAHLSLCMPTPYTTTTHVAMLLEERIITFLFPSSENEGFSQEFQSLGAQANS